MNRKLAFGYIFSIVIFGAIFVWSGQFVGYSNNLDFSIINFRETGKVYDRDPGDVNSDLVFVFGDDVLLEMVIDEKSYCTLDDHEILCMALSITFDKLFHGRRVFLEGVRRGEIVFVRNITVLDE